ESTMLPRAVLLRGWSGPLNGSFVARIRRGPSRPTPEFFDKAVARGTKRRSGTAVGKAVHRTDQAGEESSRTGKWASCETHSYYGAKMKKRYVVLVAILGIFMDQARCQRAAPIKLRQTYELPAEG